MTRNRPHPERDERPAAGLAPVPAQRDLPAGREAILKEHLMTELRNASHGPAAARQRRRWPAAVAVTAASAAAVAAATTLALWPGAGQPAVPGQHPAAGQLTPAARLLGKIAVAAARQPAPAVRDSQYTYISSLVQFTSCSASASGSGSKCTLAKPQLRQVWLPVSDLCKPGLLREPAAGLASVPLNDGAGGRCPSPGGLGNPTYRYLQSLPANPRALLNLIYAGTKGQGSSRDGEAFTAIGDLLRESVAPPRVSATLYRAAALIPGVTVVPGAADAAGRRGIAVSFTETYPPRPAAQPRPSAAASAPATGLREEWIFSRTTLQWLGERDISLPSGTLNGASAVLQRGIVGRPGQVPAGH